MGQRLFTEEIRQMRERGLSPETTPSSASPTSAPSAPSPVPVSDGGPVLEAIQALRQDIADLKNGGASINPDVFKREVEEASRLRSELKALSDCIVETKQEIAALHHPLAGENQLGDMTHQLDAVVLATEAATQTILESAESIDDVVSKLVNQASSDERGQLEEVSEKVVAIFEACNFQDITGQRVTKVVNTLKRVESSVTNMMEIMGGDSAFADVVPPKDEEADSDKALLQGPQLAGQGISQDDIDSLFD